LKSIKIFGEAKAVADKGATGAKKMAKKGKIVVVDKSKVYFIRNVNLRMLL
jgi:hypothetical protein